MHSICVWNHRAGACLAGLMTLMVVASSAWGEIDRSRYMSADEVRPGMKGYGRTVMSGTRIDTFNIEVVSVMRNAWYAKQDVILVRCSGLNLEHSGIIGGMSGSPCFIKDDSGKDRMIGAVAYGWSFNKDPICGVQPILQMVDVAQVRSPKPGAETKPAAAGGVKAPSAGGSGLSIGEVVARNWRWPVPPETSRWGVFRDQIVAAKAERSKEQAPSTDRLMRLAVPVMVSGVSEASLAMLREEFEPLGLTVVPSGGAANSAAAEADNVKMEPGSVLCIPIMTGDVQMEALGTCTEVAGDWVLGFGHQFYADGAVQLPVATGMVHTVISSVMRSNKLGAALRTVGTLYGDEATAVFGVRGKSPALLPLDVKLKDVRGEQNFHYDIVLEDIMTGLMVATGVTESALSHSVPPPEHTIRYSVETDFGDLGTFRTSNMAAQDRLFGVMVDSSEPVMMMARSPLGRTRPSRIRVEMTIEEGARMAEYDDATLPRTVYKPGETVTARVRWFHYRSKPQYTSATYELKLPADLPDGDYRLTLASAVGHVRALQTEKPHWFMVETPAQMLQAINRLGACPDNRVYMRLDLPTGGLALHRVEMPELPSFRQKIYSDSKRADVQKYSDSLVVQHETGFAVRGERSFAIKVSRTADQ